MADARSRERDAANAGLSSSAPAVSCCSRFNSRFCCFNISSRSRSCCQPTRTVNVPFCPWRHGDWCRYLVGGEDPEQLTPQLLVLVAHRERVLLQTLVRFLPVHRDRGSPPSAHRLRCSPRWGPVSFLPARLGPPAGVRSGSLPAEMPASLPGAEPAPPARRPMVPSAAYEGGPGPRVQWYFGCSELFGMFLLQLSDGGFQGGNLCLLRGAARLVPHGPL
jgi:hypothetical protein